MTSIDLKNDSADCLNRCFGVCMHIYCTVPRPQKSISLLTVIKESRPISPRHNKHLFHATNIISESCGTDWPFPSSRKSRINGTKNIPTSRPDKRPFPVFQIFNYSNYFASIAIDSFAVFHEDKQYKHSRSLPRNACVACETKLCVTTKKVWLPDRRTDRQTGATLDKVIPMCRYASQATQKWNHQCKNYNGSGLCLAYFRLFQTQTLSESKVFYDTPGMKLICVARTPSTTSGEWGRDKTVASDSRTPACTVIFCTWQGWMVMTLYWTARWQWIQFAIITMMYMMYMYMP